MDTLLMVLDGLKTMQDPTDITIINLLAEHIRVTDFNTMIVNTSRPNIDEDTMIKTLYVDVESLSWTELSNIINCLPNLENLIIRVHNLIGGTSRMLNIINNNSLKAFMILVNGSYCNNIVNSSIFLRDWNSHIHTGSLHVYYQNGAYDPSVITLLHSNELNNLLVMNCSEPEVESDFSEAVTDSDSGTIDSEGHPEVAEKLILLEK
jgi:hypothetical protein